LRTVGRIYAHANETRRDIGVGKWPFDVISVIFPVEETKEEEESLPLIARYPSREGSGLSGGGDDLPFQPRRGIRVHRRVNGFCDNTSLLSRYSRWNVILWSLYIEREERRQARIRDRGSALACFLMHKTNFEERALLTFLSLADIHCRKRAKRLPVFWKVQRERERRAISERLNLMNLWSIKTITRLNYARLVIERESEIRFARFSPNRSDNKQTKREATIQIHSVLESYSSHPRLHT